MISGWDTRWPEELEAKLTELWSFEPQLSTAKIGLRLGVSKNAVIGKAHRLKLPPRRSPIRDAAEGWTESRIAHLRIMKMAGLSHKAMAERLHVGRSNLQDQLTKQKLTAPRARCSLPPLKSLEQIIAAVKKPAPSPTPKPANFGKCCFVLGDPNRSSWRYCDDPITTRGSYCDAHRAIVYRSKPTRTLQEVA